MGSELESYERAVVIRSIAVRNRSGGGSVEAQVRSISAGWRFRTGSLAVLLLLSVVVAPALAAIL